MQSFSSKLSYLVSTVSLLTRSHTRSLSSYHTSSILFSVLHNHSKPSSSTLYYTNLPNRRLILMYGPDSAFFLHSLSTNTVNGSTSFPHHGWYTLFLNSRGRLLYDIIVYPVTDLNWKNWLSDSSTKILSESSSSWSYTSSLITDSPASSLPTYASTRWACLLELDACQVDSFIAHVNRYKLRSKFFLQIMDPSVLSPWVFWLPTLPSLSYSDNILHSTFTTRLDKLIESNLLTLPDPRLFGLSFRLLASNSSDKINNLTLSKLTPILHEYFSKVHCLPDTVDVTAKNVTPAYYTLHRYVNAIPEGADDLPQGNCIPHECNMDYLGAIDFKKGCYVGQELTIRTEHTGVVRKRYLPCKLSINSPNSMGVTLTNHVSHSLRDWELKKAGSPSRSVGKWINGPVSIAQDDWVGLALCRLEYFASALTNSAINSGDAHPKNLNATTDLPILVPPRGAAETNIISSMPLKHYCVKASPPLWLLSKMTSKLSARNKPYS